MIKHLVRSTIPSRATWCNDVFSPDDSEAERVALQPFATTCRQCLHRALEAAQATADSIAARLRELREQDAADDVATSHGERRGGK